MYKPYLLIFFVSYVVTCKTQSYVGEVFYKNAYQYLKIQCDAPDSCTYSMPYLDGEKRYQLPSQWIDSTWSTYRGVEDWRFNILISDSGIQGFLAIDGQSQPLKLYEQLKGISMDKMADYIGNYQSADGKMVVVYTRFGYLHIMSPISEETMSLKPIGPDLFWCVSGEEVQFTELDSVSHILTLTDRSGTKIRFERVGATIIEQKFEVIDDDSIYVEIFIPPGEENRPACLILPGGGQTGIDNNLYEARYLAAYGIVAMVFDKSGFGKSKGPGHFYRQSFEEKNDQYLELFKRLRNHKNVDADRVGVMGLSEGGRLALMMAIDLGKELNFCNVISGPIMNFAEGQYYAMDQHHRILGVSEELNRKIQGLWEGYYQGILRDTIDQKLIDEINHIRGGHERLFLPPEQNIIPVSPNKSDIMNNRLLTQAESIQCPILFQYGEHDTRVNWRKSLSNFRASSQYLNLVDTIIYPRGNHSLMTPEYKICTSYMDDKIKWFKKIGLLQP